MQDTADEEKGWREFQRQKSFKEGGIQLWAEGLLDDQKPLEVLYEKHPETDNDIIILKYDTKVAVVSPVSGFDLVQLLLMLRVNQLKEDSEKESE